MWRRQNDRRRQRGHVLIAASHVEPVAIVEVDFVVDHVAEAECGPVVLDGV